MKLANKSFTLSGTYLNQLLTRAIKQGKEAVMIVVFSGSGVRATISLERE